MPYPVEKVLAAQQQQTFTDIRPNLTAIRYNGIECDIKHSQYLAVYTPAHLVGRGTYADVFVAKGYTINYPQRQLTYNNEIVVKRIAHLDDAKRELIANEYNFGKKIPHLGMRPPVYINDTCYLMMNYIPGKELFELITSKVFKNKDQKLELTYKLLRAYLEQVANHQIVHLDLKPENIIVELEPEIKVRIVDYGFARPATDYGMIACGSLCYAAPEIFSRQPKLYRPCDIYSLAKIIAALWVTDYYLFDDEALSIMIEKTNKSSEWLGKHPEGFGETPQLLSLLQRMLAYNPRERPNIDEAIAIFGRDYPEVAANINGVTYQPKQKTSFADRFLSLSDENRAHITTIDSNLALLNQYAEDIATKYPDDSRIIKEFSASLYLIMNQHSDDPNTMKKLLLDTIYQPEIKNCALKHKYVAYLWKNICAAVLGLGIIYGIASLIHYQRTGRYTFFQSAIKTSYDRITCEANTIANMQVTSV